MPCNWGIFLTAGELVEDHVMLTQSKPDPFDIPSIQDDECALGLVSAHITTPVIPMTPSPATVLASACAE
jgi:hypothetical protein